MKKERAVVKIRALIELIENIKDAKCVFERSKIPSTYQYELNTFRDLGYVVKLDRGLCHYPKPIPEKEIPIIAECAIDVRAKANDMIKQKRA